MFTSKQNQKGDVKMESKMDKIQKSYMDNLSQDLCNTCEGAQFMAKYLTSRSAISELEKNGNKTVMFHVKHCGF